MKALVGAFNQEKALVGVFSVIVKPIVEPMDRLQHYIIVTLHDLHEAGDDHERGRLRHVLAVAQAARVDGVAGVEENA